MAGSGAVVERRHAVFRDVDGFSERLQTDQIPIQALGKKLPAHLVNEAVGLHGAAGALEHDVPAAAVAEYAHVVVDANNVVASEQAGDGLALADRGRDDALTETE